MTPYSKYQEGLHNLFNKADLKMVLGCTLAGLANYALYFIVRIGY